MVCDHTVKLLSRTGNREMGHSIGSALMNVNSNLVHVMDKQEVTYFLDLSAAFDTVDYDLLLNRLHSRHEFIGTVLD